MGVRQIIAHDDSGRILRIAASASKSTHHTSPRRAATVSPSRPPLSQRLLLLCGVNRAVACRSSLTTCGRARLPKTLIFLRPTTRISPVHHFHGDRHPLAWLDSFLRIYALRIMPCRVDSGLVRNWPAGASLAAVSAACSMRWACAGRAAWPCTCRCPGWTGNGRHPPAGATALTCCCRPS